MASFLIIAIFATFAALVIFKVIQKNQVVDQPLTAPEAFRSFATIQDFSPNRTAPRLTGNGVSRAIVVVAFGLISIGVMAAFIHRYNKDAKLKDGLATTGQIESVSHGKHGYQVSYKFDVNGVAYSGSGMLSRVDMPKNGDHSPVTVRYLASDPSINRLENERYLPLLTFIMPLFLIFVTILIGYQLLNDKLLITKGVTTTAIIVGRIFVKGGQRVYYDFADRNGRVHRGKSFVQQTSNLDVNIGSNQPVMYLPEQPTQNSLVHSMNWKK